jgi:hypothetical protein
MYKKEIFEDLSKHQLKNIDLKYKFTTRELLRLSKYFDETPFNQNKCILSNRYNPKGNAKNRNYISFAIKGIKKTLTRLFYINFIGKLEELENIKYICEHGGYCFNPDHIKINSRQRHLIIKENIQTKYKNLGKNEEDYMIFFD